MKWSKFPSVRRAIAATAPICLAFAVTVACSLLDEGTKTGPADTVSMSDSEVTALLNQLTVAPEGAMTGYDRDKFPHWDRNKPEHGFGAEYAKYSKCTSRDVMMLRDATGDVKLDPATCELTIGKDGGWLDQYGVLDRKTGNLKPYKEITNPSGVDAEHIVPLAEAWRSGAKELDVDTRRRIANDAVNLVASDPSANRSKGDQDITDYLPPGNFRCAYIARYLQIKVKYKLTIDPEEQSALKTAVADCAAKGGFK